MHTPPGAWATTQNGHMSAGALYPPRARQTCMSPAVGKISTVATHLHRRGIDVAVSGIHHFVLLNVRPVGRRTSHRMHGAE